MAGSENTTPLPEAADLITAADIDTNANHEARVQDLLIADRLGMAQPLNIRALIEANMAELKAYGEVFTRPVKTGRKGGRPSKEYLLNEGQSLCLCALSRAPKAPQVRRGLITAFMELRRRELDTVSVPPPAMAEPPFCKECAAKLWWNFGGINQTQHPFRNRPLDQTDMQVLQAVRDRIDAEVKDRIGKRIDKAMAAALKVVSAPDDETDGDSHERS